ncbi:MAG TPA: hypothetical protein P5572_17800, partial [Phycisphaerae bacterium]|nr:hypothetical protein [Phycisphaerae bacterium]
MNAGRWGSQVTSRLGQGLGRWMLLCAPLFTLSPVLADAPPADVATARRMLKQGQVAQAQAVLEELAAGEPDAE